MNGYSAAIKLKRSQIVALVGLIGTDILLCATCKFQPETTSRLIHSNASTVTYVLINSKTGIKRYVGQHQPLPPLFKANDWVSQD